MCGGGDKDMALKREHSSMVSSVGNPCSGDVIHRTGTYLKL